MKRAELIEWSNQREIFEKKCKKSTDLMRFFDQSQLYLALLRTLS